MWTIKKDNTHSKYPFVDYEVYSGQLKGRA